jgi:polyphosphate kinase
MVATTGRTRKRAAASAERLINRELSFLDYDARLLDLAGDETLPLLERVFFLKVSAEMLDEFFMVRVAGLTGQTEAGVSRRLPDGRTPQQTLDEARERVLEVYGSHAGLWRDELLPALAAERIVVSSVEELEPEELGELDDRFQREIFPVLTPLAVGPGQPFPYISALSISLGLFVADPETGEERFARVKVPEGLPRFFPVGSRGRFVPLERVLSHYLPKLFPGMEILERSLFRVTRDGDLEVADEADDLLEAVELELRKRRFNKAIRLEVAESIGDELLDLLVRELALDRRNVSRHRGLIDLSCLWFLHGLDRSDLKDHPWPPLTAGRLFLAEESDRSIFSVMRDRAVLVHHPYESFASSVEVFLEQSAEDARVQSIKMTLYRAGGDSPIIRSLIKAAERGKQVAVLVELKARFDEANNVQWAKQLERAGVHVIYGMVGLKTHSKVVLVVRDDGDQLRRYCHIGTGNYNSKTARLYEDLGFLTCDNEIGADVTQLFNHLTGYSRSEEYRTLLVAPRDLKRQLIDLIEHEASFGRDGRITLKCNSIADVKVVEALYAASAAGVQVDCVVRGICTMRAGVTGLSDNIRVRSILGRYLEHSRIYRFGHGDDDDRPLYLIGSADLMPRNLDRRVEVLVPMDHPKHQEWLDQVLSFDLSDEIVRWELQPDDGWARVGPRDVYEPDAQELMYRWTVERQHQVRR